MRNGTRRGSVIGMNKKKNTSFYQIYIHDIEIDKYIPILKWKFAQFIKEGWILKDIKKN